jgi:hypothetical protein
VLLMLAKTVIVLNKRGQKLANTDCAKARKLLRKQMAKIWCKEPFTIQLLVSTGETMNCIESHE